MNHDDIIQVQITFLLTGLNNKLWAIFKTVCCHIAHPIGSLSCVAMRLHPHIINIIITDKNDAHSTTRYKTLTCSSEINHVGLTTKPKIWFFQGETQDWSYLTSQKGECDESYWKVARWKHTYMSGFSFSHLPPPRCFGLLDQKVEAVLKALL